MDKKQFRKLIKVAKRMNAGESIHLTMVDEGLLEIFKLDDETVEVFWFSEYHELSIDELEKWLIVLEEDIKTWKKTLIK